MNQSGLIAAALVAGFVLWLAMTKRLTTYWSLLMGLPQASPAESGQAGAQATSDTAASMLDGAAGGASILSGPLGAVIGALKIFGVTPSRLVNGKLTTGG